jgi:hypothetical protein
VSGHLPVLAAADSSEKGRRGFIEAFFEDVMAIEAAAEASAQNGALGPHST